LYCELARLAVAGTGLTREKGFVKLTVSSIAERSIIRRQAGGRQAPASYASPSLVAAATRPPRLSAGAASRRRHPAAPPAALMPPACRPPALIVQAFFCYLRKLTGNLYIGKVNVVLLTHSESTMFITLFLILLITHTSDCFQSIPNVH